MAKSKNYEEFVEKFKPKITTDDCYTPPAVYECILNYVKKQFKIPDSTRIVRPFYPDKDYTKEDYSGDCIVVDNPPFSILSKICSYYIDNNIRYFLFAPHLMLFSNRCQDTKIIANAIIVYENGAKVPTSFRTNMYNNLAIVADPYYAKAIDRIKEDNKVNLPKYQYPPTVITSARLGALVLKGGAFSLRKDEVYFTRGLQSQKPKKEIFGAGYLISNKKAAELKAAELKAAELKATKLKAAELKKEKETIYWPLSDTELKIIKNLEK